MFLFLKIKMLYLFLLFIYFWLCWVFVTVHAVLELQRAGDTLQLWFSGFSSRWLLITEYWLQGMQASVVAARGLTPCGCQALELRLKRLSGTKAQLLRSTWHLPRSGMEVVSPALTGGLFTTGPPGKPCFFGQRTIWSCHGLPCPSWIFVKQLPGICYFSFPLNMAE